MIQSSNHLIVCLLEKVFLNCSVEWTDAEQYGDMIDEIIVVKKRQPRNELFEERMMGSADHEVIVDAEHFRRWKQSQMRRLRIECLHRSDEFSKRPTACVVHINVDATQMKEKDVSERIDALNVVCIVDVRVPIEVSLVLSNERLHFDM